MLETTANARVRSPLIAGAAVVAAASVLMPWMEWVSESRWKPAYKEWFGHGQMMTAWNGFNGDPFAPWVFGLAVVIIIAVARDHGLTGTWPVVRALCFLAIACLSIWDIAFVDYSSPTERGGLFRPSYGPYLAALSGIVGLFADLHGTRRRVREAQAKARRDSRAARGTG